MGMIGSWYEKGSVRDMRCNCVGFTRYGESMLGRVTGPMVKIMGFLLHYFFSLSDLE